MIIREKNNSHHCAVNGVQIAALRERRPLSERIWTTSTIYWGLRWPKMHLWQNFHITLTYGWIAKIFASFRKFGLRNTMATPDFRPEVEIRPFCACAIHPAIIIGTIHSLWTWLWGRYHVPQNVFLVFIMITIICITQGRTAANALRLVALTVKQKCLKSPTKCFERDLR